MTPDEIQSAIDALIKKGTIEINPRTNGAQDKGYSAIGRAIGISPSCIMRWVSGQRKISKRSAEKLQALLSDNPVHKKTAGTIKQDRHPVEMAKQMFLDHGGTKLEWCRLAYIERYKLISAVERGVSITPCGESKTVGRPSVFTPEQKRAVKRMLSKGKTIDDVITELRIPKHHRDHMQKIVRRLNQQHTR